MTDPADAPAPPESTRLDLQVELAAARRRLDAAAVDYAAALAAWEEACR